MKLRTSPIAILKILFTVIGFLLLANIIVIFFKYNMDNWWIKKIILLFDFNEEDNFPSLYSSVTIFICAFLLYYISKNLNYSKTKRSSWLILSFLFLFLGFDELFSFHEVLIPIIKKYMDFTGYFYYSWVIPYGFMVIFLGVIYIPFFLKLPKKTRTMFMLSALIYISGALGMELIGGNYQEIYGYENFQYAIIYTIEELLEMLGIAIFIYTLLYFIANYMNSNALKIKVKSDSKKS